jgi:hypothetical protein
VALGAAGLAVAALPALPFGSQPISATPDASATTKNRAVCCRGANIAASLHAAVKRR